MKAGDCGKGASVHYEARMEKAKETNLLAEKGELLFSSVELVKLILVSSARNTGYPLSAGQRADWQDWR